MILKLNTAFKNIKYSDKDHRYFTSDGEELISVTKLISRLKEPFNTNYWSTIKSYQFSGCTTRQKWIKGGFDPTCFYADSVLVNLNEDHSHLPVTPEIVAAQWKIDSLCGTIRGTYAHQYLENLENRLLDKPQVIMPPGLTTIQAISYIR